MVFGFSVFSLCIIFLLVIYYYKDDRSNSSNSDFRGVLLGSYIMQLLCIASYITNFYASNFYLFSKLYLFSIVFCFSLFCLYYGKMYLQAKYVSKGTVIKNKVSLYNKIFLGINIVTFLIFMILDVKIDGEFVNYVNINLVNWLLGGYSILTLLILFKMYKKVDKRKYAGLVWVYLVQVISLIFQSYFTLMMIVPSGIVIMVLVLYMLVENVEFLKMEDLKLERDNAVRNLISREVFLKNLNHEIRTPLNTIDGFSQIIIDSDNLTEVKDSATDIRMASKELIGIVNGMIDLAIIESGKLEIVLEDYNVYDMLDSINEIMESKLRNKKVSFVSKIDKDIPEVLLGDATRISQVILNLLMNSIKYTDSGKISFKVDCVKSSTMCRLIIKVSDTGCGIEKEELNHLFENKENGGIGLVVANYLVKLMGGYIDVESTIGKGSEFIVTIDQKIVALKQEKKSGKVKVIKPFKASGKRILIVDDNKLNLKVASKLLAAYDVSVIEANSGNECLDILDKDTEFDLILMDDLMPEMSGVETLDILKKIQRVDGYYIPVVVLTANATGGMREKYLDLGFEDYLAKPIEKAELDRILRKYLRGRK